MIYNEDCLQTMSRMTFNSIDLVVTSPPYEKLRNYNGFSFDFENVSKELFRIIKPGGVLVWVVADQTKNGSESGNSFRQALRFMELGFNLHDTMVYGKKNFIPQTHNRYEQAFEYMFVFVKGKLKTFNPIMIPAKTAGQVMNLSRKGYGFKGGAYRRRNAEIKTAELKRSGNIFYYACGSSGKNHPAVFPSKLAKDHIKSWSNPGDSVYDPFMGSGTVAEMCIYLERRYVGSEISLDYCNDIKERLRKAALIYNSDLL